MAVAVAPDIIAVCTACEWSEYLVAGVDDPPGDGRCPHCDSQVIGLPSPRVVAADIDIGDLLDDREDRGGGIDIPGDPRLN